MYRGDSWMSYDNERSVALKAEFAYDAGLAGVMTWSIDTDDFEGICNGPKFPLLRTLNHALHNREQGIYSAAPEIFSRTPVGVFVVSVLSLVVCHLSWH